jgi:hypothetical protein
MENNEYVGFVLNSAYGGGGVEIPEKGWEYLNSHNFNFDDVYNNYNDYNDYTFRLNPILVNGIIMHPELFHGEILLDKDQDDIIYSYGSNKKYTHLYVQFVPLIDLLAGSVSVHEYDGSESIYINKEKTKLFITSMKNLEAFNNTWKIAAEIPNNEELLKSLEHLRPLPIEPLKLPPILLKNQIVIPDNMEFRNTFNGCMLVKKIEKNK